MIKRLQGSGARRQNRDLPVRYGEAIARALNCIKNSELEPYISNVFLYGSCARREQKWNSDVDLFITLENTVRECPDYRFRIHALKSSLLNCGDDIEIDSKIVIGGDWQTDKAVFYQNVRKEGIPLWR